MAKKLELIYGSVIEQIKILTGGDKAKTAEAIGMFALYDYEGEEYDGDNILVKAAFAGMKSLTDLHKARALAGAKGGARSHGGGAPKGNQNGAKIQQAKQQAKFERGENTPLEIQQAKQQANNKQTSKGGCNSLNNSELYSAKIQQANNKQNSTSKTSKPSMIREERISLDNTSPLPELVLSKQEKELLEKETTDTALAPLNGGAVSPVSFSDSQNSSDGKATLAPCNGGASLPSERTEKNWNEGATMPHTSSDISQSLQSPPPPTPSPAPRQRTVGFAGNAPMTEAELAKMEADLRTNVKADLERSAAMADAERDAIAKGEPLPPAAKGIKPVIDDSDTAQHERETKRIHDIRQLIEMAETEEEKEKLRAYL